ncbi:hypothetical protein PCANC_03620 [Puccinia coronata f. sp. avenae]|uniref:Uncharacterized protein n=1 Tax=Puccinia coronata f. sp. avenae TaxID=200324 RepID=A0A2N5TCU4_9BASI|nr:hypothetical protein PCASD_10982 [Puccinia coronata f. sp. avenae]PLW53768.1 hypothetical protein PCANC_03620 [Puccinia coronata f. sp. avenae]
MILSQAGVAEANPQSVHQKRNQNHIHPRDSGSDDHNCIIVMCANNPDNPFHPSPSRTPPPPQTQPSTEDPSKTTDPDHLGMFDIDNDTGCA